MTDFRKIMEDANSNLEAREQKRIPNEVFEFARIKEEVSPELDREITKLIDDIRGWSEADVSESQVWAVLWSLVMMEADDNLLAVLGDWRASSAPPEEEVELPDEEPVPAEGDYMPDETGMDNEY